MTWLGLQHKFLELQQEASGLRANWNCAGWNNIGDEWYVNNCAEESISLMFLGYGLIAGGSPIKEINAFTTCASIAGEAAMCRIGGDPRSFRWINLLRGQEPGYEKCKVDMSSAAFFWLDLLKEYSPNFRQFDGYVTTRKMQAYGYLSWGRGFDPVIHTPYKAEADDRPKRLKVKLGMISAVCQASADYCAKLQGGHVPIVKLTNLAQQMQFNNGDKPRPRKTRGRSNLTKTIIACLISNPAVSGLYVSDRLDDEGVRPTPTMKELGYDSYRVAYVNNDEVKNTIDSTTSRIRGELRKKVGWLT